MLATAALGLYTKQVADQRDEAQAGSDELEAEKQQLEQQIADLEEQKAGPGAKLGSGPPDAGHHADDHPRRHHGSYGRCHPGGASRERGRPVTIRSSTGIDLDTSADNWGVNEGGTDVCVSGGPSISGPEFALVT